jgi:peptide/nickel transport system permease protein
MAEGSNDMEGRGTQFQILALTQLIVSMMGFMFGGVVVLGSLAVMMGGWETEPWLFLTAWFVQSIVVLILSYILLRIGIALLDRDVWAFSSSLYLNLVLALVFLTISGAGTIFAIAAIVPVVVLFLPDVKHYWYPSFYEDTVPRIKELRHALYLIRKSPLVVAGIVILTSFIAIALLAPYITTYGPEQRIWADPNLPPGSPSSVEGMPDHIWGTDDSGGDIYSRLIWAAQVDLKIAFSVVIVALAIGTFVGAVAGYYGGKIDEVVMRVTDVFFAFPGLVLCMAIVMALGERSLDNISIALMVVWWPTYARLVRGQVLAEREKLYVEAARSIGAGDGRILLFHIIPNTIQPLIVQSTMDVGSVLLTAAGLAFIGFGPPAGAAEWGLMIAIGQLYFTMNQYAILFPGIAILLTALASNLVGDGLRDILDPKLRRR